MKQLIILILTLMTSLNMVAQTPTLFPYPVPPESLPVGRPRANFMVEHFWDNCHWKTAYNSPSQMETTIRDFANFLPLAAADTVYSSINNLIKHSQKAPANFATLMHIAEATFYSDSAVIFSDEVYLPFAQAASKFKKFKADKRAYYARQAQIINTSAEGKTLPNITAYNQQGASISLNDTTSGAASYVIILENTNNSAERFERVRFAANISANKLVEAGLLKPILVATNKPDSSWWTSVSNLPKQWTVTYMPNAAEYFDLRISPAVYMLNNEMTIIAKWLPLNTLTSNCEQLIRAIESQQ